MSMIDLYVPCIACGEAIYVTKDGVCDKCLDFYSRPGEVKQLLKLIIRNAYYSTYEDEQCVYCGHDQYDTVKREHYDSCDFKYLLPEYATNGGVLPCHK